MVEHPHNKSLFFKSTILIGHKLNLLFTSFNSQYKMCDKLSEENSKISLQMHIFVQIDTRDRYFQIDNFTKQA